MKITQQCLSVIILSIVLLKKTIHIATSSINALVLYTIVIIYFFGLFRLSACLAFLVDGLEGNTSLEPNTSYPYT